MRGALLWLTCVVAACRNDHGVTVVVHPSTGVEKVRLYVGMGSATTTDLTDDSHITIANAQYWIRDPGNELDIQAVTNGRDVTFNFDTNATIPIVIGVGYDAQNEPIAAGALDGIDPSQLRNDFAGFELTLATADPFSTTTSSPLQLGLWSPSGTDLVDASCAGLIDGDGHRYFVVLDDDQDCDGYLTTDTVNECTPDYFRGSRGGDANAPNCLVMGAAACRLGGIPCKDGSPAQAGCAASTTCLPTNLCGECTQPHPADFKCADNIAAVLSPADVAKTPHYDCTVAIDDSDNVCAAVEIDRPPTGGYDCTGFTIGQMDTATINGVKLAAKTESGVSCGVSLAVDGHSTVIDPAATPATLFDFALVNQGGVAIPAVFTFSRDVGCAQPTKCVLDHLVFDDPSQARCASGWGPPAPVMMGGVVVEASDPTLTSDQTTMYFVAAGMLEKTTKTNGNWGTPTPVANVTAINVGSPDLSPDGSMIAYTGGVAGMAQIYLASTATAGAGVALSSLGAMISFTGVTFVKDNPSQPNVHRLLAAGITGGGVQELFDVVYTPTTLMSVVPLTLANSPAAPDKPHVSPDGLHLYFEGGTKRGLYVASRRTLDELFTYAVALEELTVNADEIGGAWVGGGGRTMYLTANHAASVVSHIYTTTRGNL